MKRKLFSLTLVLLIALTLLPTSALAANSVTRNDITLSEVVISDKFESWADSEAQFLGPSNKEYAFSDKTYYYFGEVGHWYEEDQAWGYGALWFYLIPQDATITFHLTGSNRVCHIEGYALEASKNEAEAFDATFTGSFTYTATSAENYTTTLAEIRQQIPRFTYLTCWVEDEWEKGTDIMFHTGTSSASGNTSPTQSATPAFTDVPANAYYSDPVSWAVAQKITSGKTATTFAPGVTCTRGQILTFLWRSQGSVTSKAANPFGEQVSTDAYYYQALLWAYENGLLEEYNRKQFNPNEPCTRSDATLFMWHVAGSPSIIKSSSLTDLPNDGRRKQAIIWATEENITQGTTATTFSPDNICTRGQIVTFLYRAYAK